LRYLSAHRKRDRDCRGYGEGGVEMIDERDRVDFIETERYELFEGPGYKFHFDRRDFLKTLGVGIVFIVPLGRAIAQQRGQGESGRGGFNERLPNDIGAWIHINEDGGVTVMTGKVEVGQNARTLLTQAVADELHVPLASIRVVMGDTDLTPFDMGTFGSRTTPTMVPQLRKVSAAARDLLIDLAAQAWRLDRSQRERLVTANGRITDPETQRAVDYAELVKERK